MHSSTLCDSDFEIIADSRPIELADYFAGHTNTKRLGLLTPNRCEGTGAITLIMAHVTAFYNAYRAAGEEFFAYPDYFTFQSTEPVAAYGMFDIWPDHKSVLVEQDPIARLNAITDRAINILLVPDGDPASHEYQRQQLAAAERLIDTCYAYSPDGAVADPDLIIRCKAEPFAAWSQSVFESIPDNKQAALQWKTTHGQGQFLEQSFRRIGRQEALALL
jgi:hypothetical protein